MSSASPKLLLVANSSEVAELFKLLEDAGFPQPALGLGGDETMDLYERHQPDVVLLVAGVTHGDLPALASAIRSGSYGRPAPIVLIASEDGKTQRPADARDIEFDQFVARPLSASSLGEAIHSSTQAATGARINAAMELAIESFVADAMDSLSSGPVEAAALGASSAREATAVLVARDDTAVLQPKRRAATAVLPVESHEKAALEDGKEDASSRGYELDSASRELLDRVLPNETLDVDIEELDGISDSRPSYREEGAEGGGGDFARQLRQKMSAMAERLFPGQNTAEHSAAAIVPSHAAHTEIDLHEIVEEPSADTSSEGSIGLGAPTHALVNESEITVARDGGSDSGIELGLPLSGEIDGHARDVAALLGRFWCTRFSGRLVLRCNEEEKRIEFDKGSVIFASSESSDDRMGGLLLREGKINEEQLAHCRQQVSSSGRRMGEILVDLGYLKPRELLPAVRQHLEDILYSVFAWTAGNYDAMPEQAIEERIRLSRHPAALLVEGIRRKYDAERLANCLGDESTVIRALGGETLSAVVGATELSAAENKAIGMFDGKHSIAAIAEACALEALRVAQLAHAWVCLGVGQRVDADAEEGVSRAGGKTHLVGETDLEIDRKRVLAKHTLVKEADYFQLLGVRMDASAFEIRRAYEAAQRYFCVESFPLELQDELKAPLKEIIEVIEEAYLVLSDDRVRNSYRANLH